MLMIPKLFFLSQNKTTVLWRTLEAILKTWHVMIINIFYAIVQSSGKYQKKKRTKEERLVQINAFIVKKKGV